MNDSIQALISELEQEARGTRRLLERVPEDKLAWRPHDKSMTLGQLAYHVATIPGNVSRLLLIDQMDASQANFTPPQPNSTSEILQAFESALAEGKRNLSQMTAESASSTWTLTHGERVIFSIPRFGVARMVLLNHWYHHRGQLTVYLRFLDVPLPAVFGRSADESPF